MVPKIGTFRRTVMIALAIALVAVVAVFVVVAVWGLRATYALPDPESVSSSPSRTLAQFAGPIVEARAVIRPLVAHYPGLSVSVGVGRDIVWSEGLGYADLAQKTPVSPTTPFRVYSLSKALTAAAAARLSEEGKLDLDSPVTGYLPDLPGHYSQVTARQLIGHLAGVRDYEKGELMKLSGSGCASVSDALDAFISDPLIHAPGERYEYSSFGYVLLSAVIESAAGESFERYIREAILKPSWMHNTGIESHRADDPEAAAFYRPAFFGRVMEAPEIDNTCKWGAGAFLSTSDDIVSFGLALLNGKIVGDETLAMIFTPIGTSSVEKTSYAFGWAVGEDSGGRRRASHSGGAIGGKAALYVLLDAKVVVAILANMDGERLTNEAAQIAELFAAR